MTMKKTRAIIYISPPIKAVLDAAPDRSVSGRIADVCERYMQFEARGKIIMQFDRDVVKAARKLMFDAIGELFDDESLWLEVDKMVQESLDENSHCHLRFDDHFECGAEGLVAIYEATQYAEIILPGGFDDDLPRQLRGLDKFIGQLQECRAQLLAQMDEASR